MNRTVWVAAVFCGALWGQAPVYTADGLVNASDYSRGPFAPNSVVSLFGSNLSFSTVSYSTPAGTTLPIQLASVRVFVQNISAPLLYVSPGQINFIIPSDLAAGTVTVAVVRQSITGPLVSITLNQSAPALFVTPAKLAIAEDWNLNYAVISADLPAKPGDILILYLTGLGKTLPETIPGAIPSLPAPIANPAGLTVLLNGAPIDSSLIKYAGATPGYAGLYQINFFLPPDTPPNPEIRISLAGQTSAAAIQLPVQM